MNHTPGPWMIKLDSDKNPYLTGDKQIVVTDSRQFYIASVHADADEHVAVVYEEQLSNACIIVAATEMLEALKMVESCFAPEDNDVTATKVRSAIAKAEWRI